MVSMASVAPVRFKWARYHPELTLPDPVRGQIRVFEVIFGPSRSLPKAPGASWRLRGIVWGDFYCYGAIFIAAG